MQFREAQLVCLIGARKYKKKNTMLLPLLINLKMFGTEDSDGRSRKKNRKNQREEVDKILKRDEEEILEHIKRFLQCL